MPVPFPFPVDVPFRIRSDLTPLAQMGGTAFPADRSDAVVHAAKRAALLRHPRRVRVVADDLPDEESLASTLERAVEGLAALRPDLIHRAGPGDEGPRFQGARDAWVFPALSDDDVHAVRALPAAWHLAEAAALTVPDDLVFLGAGSGDRTGRARFLHVAAPSRWAPDLHAGSTLAALHAPVGGGDRLRRATPALVKAMTHKGPFVRHGFSLVGTGALDLHPLGPHAESADVTASLDDIWFRVERQTIVAARGGGVATFAIRIFVAPLVEVLREVPGRAARLADAVASMEPEVLAYKGMTRHGAALVGALRAWNDGAAVTPC